MDTALFSEVDASDPRYAALKRYALDIARNPDPGSEFDRSTMAIREIPDDRLLSLMLGNGYDMMMGYHDSGDGEYDVCGHYAFQMHDGSDGEHEAGCHVFAVCTAEQYKTHPKVFLDLLKGFMGQMGRKRVPRVRISEGNSRNMQSLLRVLDLWKKKFGVDWVDHEKFWVYLDDGPD